MDKQIEVYQNLDTKSNQSLVIIPKSEKAQDKLNFNPSYPKKKKARTRLQHKKSLQILNDLAKVYIQNPHVLRNSDLLSLRRFAEKKNNHVRKKRAAIGLESDKLNSHLEIKIQGQLDRRLLEKQFLAYQRYAIKSYGVVYDHYKDKGTKIRTAEHFNMPSETSRQKSVRKSSTSQAKRDGFQEHYRHQRSSSIASSNSSLSNVPKEQIGPHVSLRSKNENSLDRSISINNEYNQLRDLTKLQQRITISNNQKRYLMIGQLCHSQQTSKNRRQSKKFPCAKNNPICTMKQKYNYRRQKNQCYYQASSPCKAQLDQVPFTINKQSDIVKQTVLQRHRVKKLILNSEDSIDIRQSQTKAFVQPKFREQSIKFRVQKITEPNYDVKRSAQLSNDQKDLQSSQIEILNKQSNLQKIDSSTPKYSHIFNRNNNRNNNYLPPRVFVMNSEDKFIRRVLLEFYWKQAPLTTNVYTLKWSYKQSTQDYQFLKAKNITKEIFQNKSKEIYSLRSGYVPRGSNKSTKLRKELKESKVMKFYNHIKNNIMVTKIGLHRVSQRLSQGCEHPDRFIPRTYNLQQEIDQFTEDYYQTTIRIIIKKHYQHFCSKLGANWVHKVHTKLQGNLLQIQQLLQLAKDHSKAYYLIDQKQDNGFLVNIPLLIYALIYAAKTIQRQYNQLNIEQNEQQTISCKFEKVLKDGRVMDSLVKLSRVQPFFQQYQNIKYTSKPSSQENDRMLEISSRDKPKIEISKDYYVKINQDHHLMTPSLWLVFLVTQYHILFQHQLPQLYMTDGIHNLWIIKHSLGSKGSGIQICHNLEEVILASRNQTTQSKVIQKYIQNIWILDEKRISQQFASRQNSVQTPLKKEKAFAILQKNKLFGKKFDIRQWVLLAPPSFYIFSTFYLKICSRKYDLNNPGDYYCHLSNYSLNKDVYQEQAKEDSIMSQQQFQDTLRILYTNSQDRMRVVKAKIKQHIYRVVKEAINDFQYIPGCFQVVGFDIVLDCQLNPWILEVNMSPACSERTEWVKIMAENMARDTLRKVLPAELLTPLTVKQNQESKIVSQKHQWVQLPICKISSVNVTERLEVIGKKAQIHKQSAEQIESYSTTKQIESRVIKIQNMIRRKLKK